MKKILMIALAAMFCVTVQAQEQEQKVTDQVKKEMVTDDYKIIKDEVVDGIRYVTAAPSAMVCSKQIDIQIKDGIIQSVVYTRGCDGNAKGIGALIKGMSVEEAIKRLEGITCGKRPTSCPDQLAQILKSLN
jgi:uncharacterized protein (TIGR03905 family)